MDIMTSEEMAEIFKKLKAIQTKDEPNFQKQVNSLYELQKSMGLNLPHMLSNSMQNKAFNIASGIHTYLQTNMMLNACVSAKESSELAKQSCGLAKRSCFWAMVAAIAACISVVLTWWLN
jgi:hypothetical protein